MAHFITIFTERQFFPDALAHFSDQNWYFYIGALCKQQSIVLIAKIEYVFKKLGLTILVVMSKKNTFLTKHFYGTDDLAEGK